MSGTIHINTELMRDLAARFQLNCQYAQEKLIAELRAMSAQVESDWVGISRNHYDELFQQWCHSVQSLITWGEQIGTHLNNTANHFDQADNS
jgi:WXG100 family type VII secretion target